MTKFIAVPGAGGVFQQSFLQQLVSIHFPSGKLVRISVTGSGPGSNFAKITIDFPFGRFTAPITDLILSSTGIIPAIVDPPSPEMITNLYAWSVLNDEGNFVYYNTGKVASLFGEYTPVTITIPAFNGVPAFTDEHVIVWFYRYAAGNTPSGPFDPALEGPGFVGGLLAIFDPSQTSVYSVGQLLDMINEVADETSTQALPINDGGDATKGDELVAALFAGSHIDPSAGGPNTYVATVLSSSSETLSAGWGLLGGLFNTKGGAFVPAPLASISDFDIGDSTPPVTITIDVDTTADTMVEHKT
jgi:hypothetical protein